MQALVEAGDERLLDEYVASLNSTDRLRAFSRLDPGLQLHLVLLLSSEAAAEIIEDLPESHAAALIDRVGVAHAAEIVGALSSDQAADILAGFERDNAQATLAKMEPGFASKVRQLISYPDEVAGGLMEVEEHACRDCETISDFLENLSVHRNDWGHLPQRILLVDDSSRLLGAVDIVDILLTDHATSLSSLQKAVVSVSDYANLDELDEYFDHYETLGVPVVDANGLLVGRLRRRAVDERLSRRAREDQLKQQGIIGGDELRSMPVATRSRRRLSWLSINIVLNIAAASVIAVFQETLSAVVALAVFLPIVSDMSGCSGNQAVAVSMRELSLGIIQPRDLFRVWLREIAVGLLNGLALGVLLGFVTYLWLGNLLLGVIVGIALGLNTILAVSLGGTVPLILKHFRVDPAVASGPILTTVTDMCGFFLLLGMATLVLPALV